jgi:hypothetical protein
MKGDLTRGSQSDLLCSLFCLFSKVPALYILVLAYSIIPCRYYANNNNNTFLQRMACHICMCPAVEFSWRRSNGPVRSTTFKDTCDPLRVLDAGPFSKNFRTEGNSRIHRSSPGEHPLTPGFQTSRNKKQSHICCIQPRKYRSTSDDHVGHPSCECCL